MEKDRINRLTALLRVNFLLGMAGGLITAYFLLQNPSDPKNATTLSPSVQGV